MRLFQTFGVEAEFLGHLDQLLRGFRILHGFGELPGSVGLVSIVVGLGHRSTFLDEYRLRQKGSTSGTRPDMAEMRDGEIRARIDRMGEGLSGEVTVS
jgi:hypothetical protein